MKETYKTIRKKALAEFIERKSRFIAGIMPVSDEKEAIEFINKVRSEHYNATHNVYAYIVGNNICRYSDDGEPSGTAGIPVLEVLKKEELTDVAMVVTRYFGGIMLGAGGLLRAYGTAARLGVDAGGIITRTLCNVLKISSEYSLFGKIQYDILLKGYIIDKVEYTDKVTVLVNIPVTETNEFIQNINDAVNARILCEITGKNYIDIK